MRKIPRRTQTSQCDLLKVSKLLVLVDGGGAARYFCPGVLLLWQLGGANDPILMHHLMMHCISCDALNF